MRWMNCGLLLKKGKLIWVVSAYCRESKRIVRLSVGSRTNKTLNRVLISLIKNTKQIRASARLWELNSPIFRLFVGDSTKISGTIVVNSIRLNFGTPIRLAFFIVEKDAQ